MGCTGSKDKEYIDFRYVYEAVPKIRLWQKTFEALCLTENDVGRLYKIFRKIDKDSSFSIEVLELLMYLDIERTPFTKSAFSIFDDDKSGSIDFREYVCALWNYCTVLPFPSPSNILVTLLITGQSTTNMQNFICFLF